MAVTCIRKLYLRYGGIVRHGHHKSYSVHSEYVAKMVDFKRRSVLYQSGISNRWEAMEARLRRIEELVVPDPKPFAGERSAKELVGHGNIFSGGKGARCGESVYHEVLKKELKDQFLPCNTSWIAREFLRNFKHTGTVCEFVKEFRSLMLDVRVEDLETGNRGSYEDCSRVSSAGDVGHLCSFSGSVGKTRAYEDCIIDLASGGNVVRHGHHKLYSVHSEYVKMTVNSKGGSVPYKPEQPPSVGLIQQISAPQEIIKNLKMRVKEKLPQFVEKGLSNKISCLTDVVDFKLEALRAVAQTELRRQGVKDLPLAIAAVDRLDDFKVANDPKQRNDDSGEGNEEFERSRADCFICGNLEHRARDCSERGKLNAIVAE
ncbi:hypothetical protein Sango_0513300 [Sesamum angolense]|uniref:CCHC-type domain-containing protein n=1 Tax=Sesamum angolense TaxID=2727404 RepID=A0AAE1X4C2_9LAMI|nr:hypothetical protein Sango_0513300 [Sesamum angolense]